MTSSSPRRRGPRALKEGRKPWIPAFSGMTPGPGLYQSCVPERSWGCESLTGAELGSDRGSEVCGRFWVAYHALGGEQALGAPLGAPERSAETGIYSQPFERATIELHPENPPPCNIVSIPR